MTTIGDIRGIVNTLEPYLREVGFLLEGEVLVFVEPQPMYGRPAQLWKTNCLMKASNGVEERSSGRQRLLIGDTYFGFTKREVEDRLWQFKIHVLHILGLKTSQVEKEKLHLMEVSKLFHHQREVFFALIEENTPVDRALELAKLIV